MTFYKNALLFKIHARQTFSLTKQKFKTIFLEHIQWKRPCMSRVAFFTTKGIANETRTYLVLCVMRFSNAKVSVFLSVKYCNFISFLISLMHQQFTNGGCSRMRKWDSSFTLMGVSQNKNVLVFSWNDKRGKKFRKDF